MWQYYNSYDKFYNTRDPYSVHIYAGSVIESGCDDYISNPLDLEILIKLIKNKPIITVPHSCSDYSLANEVHSYDHSFKAFITCNTYKSVKK